MTNQEAIDILRNTAWSVTHEDLLRTVEAVGLAISALQAQESVDKELKCLRTEIFFLKAEKEAEKVDIFPELTAEEKKENRAYAQGYTDACKEIKAKSDLIKRQAACELCTEYFDSDDCSGGDVAMDIQSELLGLPSAQPDSCNFPQLGATCEDGDELDEAIKIAEENGKAHIHDWMPNEWAGKRRKLASWLKELKRLRTEVYFLKAEKENEPVDLLGDVPCKTCKWRVTTTEKCEECIDGVSDNYEVQEPCEDCVSRKAAIDAMTDKNITCNMDSVQDSELHRIKRAVHRILASLPSAQPHSNDSSKTQKALEKALDCISRQAAIDALIGDGPPELNYDFYYAEKIKELPSVRNGIMISKEDLLEALNSINLPVDDAVNKIFEVIQDIPSAQPEPLSDAYTKAVWTWLLDYQIKAAELKGRYTPYEVLSWVANDWRKEHE